MQNATKPNMSFKKPQLAAILNITPDSFSDGGKYNNLEAALTQAKFLLAAGADILDIGAESTRPNAQLISAQEEWARLKEILPEVIQLTKQHKTKISLDTRHADTAEHALKLGVDIINDVSGLSEANMIKIIKNYDCETVVMHNLGLPASPDNIIPKHQDVIDVVYNWGKNKIANLIEKHHIKQEKIIFDIGIGFGKDIDQSLELINNIEKFSTLGVKIYVGHSRKSFLRKYDLETELQKDLATAYFSAKMAPYVDYLRVHNVALNHQYITNQGPKSLEKLKVGFDV